MHARIQYASESTAPVRFRAPVRPERSSGAHPARPRSRGGRSRIESTLSSYHQITDPDMMADRECRTPWPSRGKVLGRATAVSRHVTRRTAAQARSPRSGGENTVAAESRPRLRVGLMSVVSTIICVP